jgi:antirestriction protein
MTSDYSIYVADLAAYNNGKLHGVWIDALSDDIQDQINDMLGQSPEGFAEEWEIHSFDGFGSVSLSKHEGIETVRNIASFLNEYDEFGAALLNHFCNDIDESRKAAEECYQGCYESLADYAQAITEDTTEIPSHLQYYIIELNHQQTHVFLNH